MGLIIIILCHFRLLLELTEIYNFNSGGVHFGNAIVLVNDEMCPHFAVAIGFMQIGPRWLLRRLLFPGLVGRKIRNIVLSDSLVVGLHELIFVLVTVVCHQLFGNILLRMLRNLLPILVVYLLDGALELLAEVLRLLQHLLDWGVVDLKGRLRRSEVGEGRRLLNANSLHNVRILVNTLLPIIWIFILRSRAIKSGLSFTTPTVFHEPAIILQLILERRYFRILHYLVFVVRLKLIGEFSYDALLLLDEGILVLYVVLHLPISLPVLVIFQFVLVGFLLYMRKLESCVLLEPFIFALLYVQIVRSLWIQFLQLFPVVLKFLDLSFQGVHLLLLFGVLFVKFFKDWRHLSKLLRQDFLCIFLDLSLYVDLVLVETLIFILDIHEFLFQNLHFFPIFLLLHPIKFFHFQNVRLLFLRLRSESGN